MAPLRRSNYSAVKSGRRRLAGDIARGHGLSVRVLDLTPGGRRDAIRGVASARSSQAVRVAGCGPSVGAWGLRASRSLRSGSAPGAALRVRTVPPVGAGLRLASHPTRPREGKEELMNRFTGTRPPHHGPEVP